MLSTVKWFDRKFDFSYGVDEYESLLQRLSSSIPRLSDLVADVPVETLSIKIDSKWSIKENIGHLIILEPLWRVRVVDLMYFVAEHDLHHFDTIVRIIDITGGK